MQLPAMILRWGLLLSRPGVSSPASSAEDWGELAARGLGAPLVGQQPSPSQRAGGAAGAGISPSVVFEGKKSERPDHMELRRRL